MTRLPVPADCGGCRPSPTVTNRRFSPRWLTPTAPSCSAWRRALTVLTAHIWFLSYGLVDQRSRECSPRDFPAWYLSSVFRFFIGTLGKGWGVPGVNRSKYGAFREVKLRPANIQAVFSVF